ncbi:MAG: hypothetical protein V1753_04955, partial [Pseudomonadota bacterium]
MFSNRGKGKVKVLGIDTSTATGSVAVLGDDVLIGEVLFTSGQTHARMLMSTLDTLLNMTGIKLVDIDGFAVG